MVVELSKQLGRTADFGVESVLDLKEFELEQDVSDAGVGREWLSTWQCFCSGRGEAHG